MKRPQRGEVDVLPLPKDDLDARLGEPPVLRHARVHLKRRRNNAAKGTDKAGKRNREDTHFRRKTRTTHTHKLSNTNPSNRDNLQPSERAHTDTCYTRQRGAALAAQEWSAAESSGRGAFRLFFLITAGWASTMTWRPGRRRCSAPSTMPMPNPMLSTARPAGPSATGAAARTDVARSTPRESSRLRLKRHAPVSSRHARVSRASGRQGAHASTHGIKNACLGVERAT